jgi:hypothetical protein
MVQEDTATDLCGARGQGDSAAHDLIKGHPESAEGHGDEVFNA